MGDPAVRTQPREQLVSSGQRRVRGGVGIVLHQLLVTSIVDLRGLPRAGDDLAAGLVQPAGRAGREIVNEVPLLITGFDIQSARPGLEMRQLPFGTHLGRQRQSFLRPGFRVDLVDLRGARPDSHVDLAVLVGDAPGLRLPRIDGVAPLEEARPAVLVPSQHMATAIPATGEGGDVGGVVLIDDDVPEEVGIFDCLIVSLDEVLNAVILGVVTPQAAQPGRNQDRFVAEGGEPPGLHIVRLAGEVLLNDGCPADEIDDVELAAYPPADDDRHRSVTLDGGAVVRHVHRCGWPLPIRRDLLLVARLIRDRGAAEGQGGRKAEDQTGRSPDEPPRSGFLVPMHSSRSFVAHQLS